MRLILIVGFVVLPGLSVWADSGLGKVMVADCSCQITNIDGIVMDPSDLMGAILPINQFPFQNRAVGIYKMDSKKTNDQNCIDEDSEQACHGSMQEAEKLAQQDCQNQASPYNEWVEVEGPKGVPEMKLLKASGLALSCLFELGN